MNAFLCTHTHTRTHTRTHKCTHIHTHTHTHSSFTPLHSDTLLWDISGLVFCHIMHSINSFGKKIRGSLRSVAIFFIKLNISPSKNVYQNQYFVNHTNIYIYYIYKLYSWCGFSGFQNYDWNICTFLAIFFFNPLMPNGAFNICCPRDAVSRTANVERTARH